MIAPHEFLFAVLLPAMISLVVLVIAWRPWNRKETRGNWAGGIAIGAAFSVGLLGLQRLPPWPPTSAQDWLFYIGAAAAILGLIDGLLKLPLIVRLLIAAAASVGAVFLVLNIQHTATARESWLWIGTAAAAMTAGFMLLEGASVRYRGSTVPVLMAVCSATLGLFMMFSGSQTFGQRSGIICMTTLAAVPLAMWSSRVSLARGGVLAFVLLYGGLLVTCYEYPENVVGYRLVLFAAAPIVGLLPLLTKLSGWKRWIACLLLAAIPLGIALIPAGIQFAREFNAQTDGYSE